MNMRTVPTRMLALAALFAGGLAQAQQAPDFLRDFVYPGNGVSSADEVYVLYADNCGRPHPDAARPATVDRSGPEILVDIYLVEPESPICIAVALPDELFAVNVGRLERGAHDIVRRLYVRAFDSNVFRKLVEARISINVGNVPNAAASGTWFDPQSPGTGVVLNLMPGATPEQRSDGAVLFIATKRVSGEAAWLSGMASFDDAVLTVPVRRAGTPGTAPPDATAEFVYTGCGSATLGSTATDLAFPQGITPLLQLTHTAGVPDCVPPAIRPDTLE